MAVNDLTGQNIQDTYQKVVQTDGVNIADGTGSALPIKFDGPDLIVSGALRAQSYIVSESVVNVSSGSTVFGDSSDDSHTFNGNITSSGTISASGMIQTAGAISSSTGITASGAFFSTHITASGNISASGHLYVDDILADDIVLRFGKGIKAAGVDGTLYDVATIAGETQMIFGDSEVNTVSLNGEKINITADSAIHGSIALRTDMGLVEFKDDTVARISFDVDTTPGISFNGIATIESLSDAISFTGGTNITASGNIRVTGSTDTAVNIDTTGHITASGDVKASSFIGTVATATQGTIDHDSLANFVANEHIDHTSVTLTAGDGLSGGGDISTNRSFAVDAAQTTITSVTNTGLKIGRATDDTFIDFGTDDKIQLKPANSIALEVETTGIDITGHITASGVIKAEHLYSTDDAQIDDNLTVGGVLTTGERIYTYITSGYNGDVVSFGTGPGGNNGDIVQGELYCLDSSQHWEKADADALATSAGMLGIAIADDLPTFLIKGFIANTAYGFTTGAILYISTTAGDVTSTAPSGNTEVVRVVGYVANSSSRSIWFDPSKTWVQVSA